MAEPSSKKKVILKKKKADKPESGVVPADEKKKKVPGKIPLAKNSNDDEDTKPKNAKKLTKKNKNEDVETKKKSKEKTTDKEEDNKNGKEEKVDQPKKKISTLFPKYQKKECDSETRKKLEAALKQTNETILHFKSLGYLTRANGTLYYKEEVKLEETGIEVKIVIQGSHFVVDTQGDKTGNDIMKQLEGKWLPSIKKWKLPIYNLEKFKECFNVIEESKLSKDELEKLQEEIREKRTNIEPQNISVEDNGDYFSITSPNFGTKAISDYLKENCHAKWRPDQKAWIVSKDYKEELEKVLEDAKSEGTIKDFEFTDGIMKHAAEDND